MKSLKEIMDSANHSVTFHLLQQTITVSPERHLYSQLRKKYSSMAVSLYQQFSAQNQYRDLADMASRAEGIFKQAISPCIQEVVNDAFSVGIYTLDANTILEECMEEWYFDAFQDALGKFTEPYYELSGSLEQMQKDLKRRKKHKRNGTFFWGIGYAVLSSVKDGGKTSDLKSDIKDSKKDLKSIFTDTDLWNALHDSYRICCFNLHCYIVEKFPQLCGIQLSGYASAEGSKQAAALMNNLKVVNVPDQQKYAIAAQILHFDPFQERFYVELTGLFPEAAQQLLKIADFFGQNGLRESLVNSLLEYAQRHVGNTAEDIERCRQDLDRKTAELGLTSADASKAYKLLDNRLARLNSVASTADSVLSGFGKLIDFGTGLLGNVKFDSKNTERFQKTFVEPALQVPNTANTQNIPNPVPQSTNTTNTHTIPDISPQEANTVNHTVFLEPVHIIDENNQRLSGATEKVQQEKIKLVGSNTKESEKATPAPQIQHHTKKSAIRTKSPNPIPVNSGSQGKQRRRVADVKRASQVQMPVQERADESLTNAVSAEPVVSLTEPDTPSEAPIVDQAEMEIVKTNSLSQELHEPVKDNINVPSSLIYLDELRTFRFKQDLNGTSSLRELTDVNNGMKAPVVPNMPMTDYASDGVSDTTHTEKQKIEQTAKSFITNTQRHTTLEPLIALPGSPKRCSNCDHICNASDTFCTRCGSVFRTSQDTTVLIKTKKCKNCGTMNYYLANYCKICKCNFDDVVLTYKSKKCKSCGAMNYDMAIYCESCKCNIDEKGGTTGVLVVIAIILWVLSHLLF